MTVLIVGGGVSGLACAITLRRRGIEATVLESAGQLGGRVRTEEHRDGFLLDHGFQVVNTSYPALARFAPPASLGLHAVPRIAMVRWAGAVHPFGLTPRSATAPFASPRSLLALARIGAGLLRSNRAALSGSDCSAETWLRQCGLSPDLIDAFFRPFFGGVLLDPTLATSAKCLRYDLRQFLVGSTALPRGGISRMVGVMTDQLSAPSIRLGARVESILRGDGGEVAGVRLAGGEEVRSQAVVVATEAPAAAQLTGLAVPTAATSEVCVHVAVDRPLLRGGRLVLDAGGVFKNVIELSATAPSYAPTGQALLAMVAPGSGSGDRREWAERALSVLHDWFPKLPAGAARVLRAEPIPFATLAQPPGIHARLQALADPGGGLFIAGEQGLAASVNGAMLSGERAARRIARRQRPAGPVVSS